MTRSSQNDEEAVRELLNALRDLDRDTVVPPPDPDRQRALMTAFDAAQRQRSTSRVGYWWMAGLSAAAALLVATALDLGREGRRGIPPSPDLSPHARPGDIRGVSPDSGVGEFISWPGAADLPPLESGELMRMDLPVAVLPSLGMTPPSAHGTAVKVDVVIGQDGLARAVRLVTD